MECSHIMTSWIFNHLLFLDWRPNDCGEFGEHHAHEIKLSNSEYIMSRLWNKDFRFRKDPHYIFYLLRQKELWDLNSGIYNLIKTKKGRPMSVGAFMDKVDHSDEYVESRLSTVFSSIHGSNQYWLQRKSELKCMIREYGSPTLFITFSCAEYIVEYLRKINGVSASYNAGRLCTEDSVSVSKVFFQFQCPLSKGVTERCCPRYCGPLLLGEGVPSAWCSTLSQAVVDKGCTRHR